MGQYPLRAPCLNLEGRVTVWAWFRYQRLLSTDLINVIEIRRRHPPTLALQAFELTNLACGYPWLRSIASLIPL